MPTHSDIPITGVRGSSRESMTSAVSWAAIIAGALAATALSVVLLALGSGLGLSSISPWANSGATASSVAVGAAVWLVVMQWLSSALGGYLAGFLRTRWVGVHSHAAFFRDTVHGFLAWCLGTLFVVTILASSASSLFGGAAQVAAAGATQAASSASDSATYAVDTLFRTDGAASTSGSAGDAKAEAARILARGVTSGLQPDDKTYLARLIANRTGISQQNAEKRIDRAVEDAKAAAEKARKAAMRFSLLVAFSMLLGAFIASAAGAIGGHERDDHDDEEARV